MVGKALTRYLPFTGIIKGALTFRSRAFISSRYSNKDGPSYHGANFFGIRSLIPMDVWAEMGMNVMSERERMSAQTFLLVCLENITILRIISRSFEKCS